MAVFYKSLMIKNMSYLALLAILLMGVLPVHAREHEGSSASHEESTEKLAMALVAKFWKEVEHQNVEGYSKLLAIGFQGLNISGHYNRNDQISGLEGLTVTKFKLKNLIAARYLDTLVISYDFLAQGTGVTSGPSIDIWHQEKCHWELVSHSYVPFQAP